MSPRWIFVAVVAAAAAAALVLMLRNGTVVSTPPVAPQEDVSSSSGAAMELVQRVDALDALKDGVTVSNTVSDAPRQTEESIARPRPVESARVPKRLSRLSGRVVSSTGEPQPHAIVSAQVFEMDESSSSTEVRAGADGRFSIRLDDDQFRDCEIHARRGEFPPLKVDVRFLRSQIDPSLDIGDIALPSEAWMILHVVDRAGVPLPDAVADGQPADKHGDCEIGPEWQLGPQVRVDAPGHWSVLVAVPKPLVARQDVQLAPCNRLVFHFIGMQQDMAELLSIRIVDTGVPLCADAESSFMRSEGGCVVAGKYRGTFSGRGVRGVTFTPDASGDLVLEGLDPSVAIDCHVQDPLGTRVHEAKLNPLGGAGLRHIDIPLAARAHELVVTVRDPKGTPLPMATVRVSTKDGTASKPTGADGKARFPLICADRVDLDVRLQGYARAGQHDLPLVREVEQVELQLERGRRLTVEVVDAKSRWVAGGTLRATASDTGTSWTGWPSSTGKYEILDLPAEGDVLLSLKIGGRVYEKRHDPNVPVARFEVPVHGRVEVKWALPPGAEGAELQVILRSTEDDTCIVWGPIADEAEGEWMVESVHPGEYDAMVLRPGEDDKWSPVVPTKHIKVLAERIVTVVLRP